MIKRAITVGKFWPFHLGHDLMIRTALSTMDMTTVIISSDTMEKNQKIRRAMMERYDSQTHSDIEFVTIVDDEIYEVDENGTALDEKYIDKWVNFFKERDPDATHFVSSDLYGKVIAEKMGIEWLPVDPDRIAVPISGTKIRSDVIKYWNYIVPEAKYDWALKIAVVGPESSGKSTLAKQIAEYHDNTAVVPEYGRTLSEVKPDLNRDDFDNIVLTQQLMMHQAVIQSPVVITDTESIITHMFAKIYLDPADADSFNEIRNFDYYNQDIDLYLVLAPTVPWVDDGHRILSDPNDRHQFYVDLLVELDEMNANYKCIDFVDWNDRSVEAYRQYDIAFQQKFEQFQSKSIVSFGCKSPQVGSLDSFTQSYDYTTRMFIPI